MIIHQNNIYIGLATNNQAEYEVVIGILAYASHLDISPLHVFLDY